MRFAFSRRRLFLVVHRIKRRRVRYVRSIFIWQELRWRGEDLGYLLTPEGRWIIGWCHQRAVVLLRSSFEGSHSL